MLHDLHVLDNLSCKGIYYEWELGEALISRVTLTTKHAEASISHSKVN